MTNILKQAEASTPSEGTLKSELSMEETHQAIKKPTLEGHRGWEHLPYLHLPSLSMANASHGLRPGDPEL